MMDSLKNKIVKLENNKEYFVLETLMDNNINYMLLLNLVDDKEIKIAFSSKFMMEALKTINSKDIRILLNSDIKPIILKTDEDENLIQLLLPIKTY